MPREITSHHVSGVTEFVSVRAEDGSGGSHLYTLVAEQSPGAAYGVKIRFQTGTGPEAGVNGVTIEAVLAILIDRLIGFQRGDLPCRENQEALSHLQQAMAALNQRTRDRADRGVKGTMRE